MGGYLVCDPLIVKKAYTYNEAGSVGVEATRGGVNKATLLKFKIFKKQDGWLWKCLKLFPIFFIFLVIFLFFYISIVLPSRNYKTGKMYFPPGFTDGHIIYFYLCYFCNILTFYWCTPWFSITIEISVNQWEVILYAPPW